MNNLAREKLVFELEHLLRHEPAMGTLFVMVLQTNYLLVVTLKNGVLNLGYPHAGWFDLLGARRFSTFCRRRGFLVQKECQKRA